VASKDGFWSEDWWGSNAKSISKLNSYFGFKTSGNEQDWEIEFADPNRVREYLQALRAETFDTDATSALILLTLHSIEEAVQTGSGMRLELKMIRNILSNDDVQQQRVSWYWSRLDAPAEIADILK
jgi:hypothetical protein